MRQYKEGVQKLPQIFTLSSEWFPAIYLSSYSNELYDVLSNPLFDNRDDLKNALNTKVETPGWLNFKNLNYPSLRERYRVCLKIFFTQWLNGIWAKSSIAEQLYDVPGIAQLLFSLLCNKFVKNRVIVDEEGARILLDVCCDFSDCILQVAENMISHTEGGVLSIRINNNWNKIKDAFEKKGMLDNSWFLRISLVDYSKRSILDNVRIKSNIKNLTLPHIFLDNTPPKEVSVENYQKVAEEYERYLNSSEHIIHHYGLAVFRNVVNQYDGCFTIKSDTRSTSGKVDRYALDSDKISHALVSRNIHIPGSEYDILLPLDNLSFM